ncbi:hypothetical protein Y5S_02107 [Alcanivorax nanhaiticus]|uniref:Uncharacterized protein n=1 Tax=Alcanivorax nanhaiticus TaxID=1177154 RepID=A0A095SJA4_9GAMM|nr:hypothetical protein [Alcanivorax nanhaiticus]KGD64741.1 hypothetical protein Y5S_02107 [Alcanivorax nanhaiticus]
MQPDILYRIQDANGTDVRIPIHLQEDHSIAVPDDFSPPAWAKLDYCQCSHCPLTTDTHAYCPIARNLAYLLPRLPSGESYRTISLEVKTEPRNYQQDTTLQRALGSLFGLICASSDCPHTRFLRPMARFHLPLSSHTETLVRSTSLYLLQQIVQNREGEQASLAGLNERYQTLNELNQCFVKRFHDRNLSDAPVNAMVLLKTIAQHLNWNLEDDLSELAPLFGTTEPGGSTNRFSQGSG